LRSFFGDHLTDVGAPDYSHAIRWKNNRRTLRFIHDAVRVRVDEGLARETPFYPQEFEHWEPLNRAQYLEISIFLQQYLLSSQGDRVGMANSVEGRFPFLDYRVVEFCNNLPVDLKLHGMTEKFLLKKLASQWLPEDIWRRPKRPYRAPIHRSFFNQDTQDYVREMLAPEAIREAGLFKTAAVSQLTEKVIQGAHIGETDDMALAGILSTQLVHEQFVRSFKMAPPIASPDDVKVCDRRKIEV
jgi:asparagine synthase (glutamine-hydrolysing)